MNKKLIISLLLVLLIGIGTIMGTYAVVINVISENGVNKIINVITIRDLLTRDDGSFNDTYYDVKNELDVNDDEMNVLMSSSYLNESLKVILDSVVDYKLNDGKKLSNDVIYDMLVDDVNMDDSININLKNKVIDKGSKYRNDISDYVYDLDVNLINGS